MVPATVASNGFETSGYNFGGSIAGASAAGAGAGTTGFSMMIGAGVGNGSTIAGEGGTTSGCGVTTAFAGVAVIGATFLLASGADFAAMPLLGAVGLIASVLAAGERVTSGATISFATGASTGVGAMAGAVGAVCTRLFGAETAVSIFAECDSEYIFTPAAILATTAIIPTAIQTGCLDFPEKLPA